MLLKLNKSFHLLISVFIRKEVTDITDSQSNDQKIQNWMIEITFFYNFPLHFLENYSNKPKFFKHTLHLQEND